MAHDKVNICFSFQGETAAPVFLALMFAAFHNQSRLLSMAHDLNKMFKRFMKFYR